MYHHYCLDPYYARVIEYEADLSLGADARSAELEIPTRWIMVWVTTVAMLSLVFGAVLRWIA